MYQYSGQPYSSSIKSPGFTVQAPQLISNQPTYPGVPKGYENFGESQVNNVYRPLTYTPSSQVNIQANPNPPVPQLIGQQNQGATQSIQQDANRGQPISQKVGETSLTNIDHRYDQYLDKGKDEEYKYNIFSAFDEPWNRCINGDKCGKFPPNECIAP